jgi:hypothetical protein
MVVEVEVSDEPWIFTDVDGKEHEIVDGFFTQCLVCGNIVQVMFKEDESIISLCDTKDCEVNNRL